MARTAERVTALEAEHERGCPLEGEMVGHRMEWWLAELSDDARKGGQNKLRAPIRTAIHCNECGSITLIDGDHTEALKALQKEKLAHGG